MAIILLNSCNMLTVRQTAKQQYRSLSFLSELLNAVP